MPKELLELLSEVPPLMALEAACTIAPPEEGKPRRFHFQAYDGGKLRLANFPLPVIVDLDRAKFSASVQALRDHDFKRPVGPITSTRIENHTIQASGHFVDAFAKERDEIVNAHEQQFQWQASIGGYHNTKQLELIRAGQEVFVNGRTFKGPVIVSREAHVREISFVSYGAGENTKAQFTAAAEWTEDDDQQLAITLEELNGRSGGQPNKVVAGATKSTSEAKLRETERKPAKRLKPTRSALRAANMEFEQYCESLGVNVTDENREALEAAWRARERDDETQENKVLKELSDLKASFQTFRNQGAAAEVDRFAEQFGVTDESLLKDLRAAAGAGDITPDDVELRLLRAAYGAGTKGFVPPGRSRQAPANQHVLEAALLSNMGWSEEQLGEHYSADTITAAMQPQYEGFGFRSLMHEFLTAHGEHVMGGRVSLDDAQRGAELEFLNRGQFRAAGGASSFSLTAITDNVANKMVLQPYNEADKTILKICKIANSTDYRPINMYRLNSSGQLLPVGNDGELESMELGDDKYLIEAEQYGRKLCITEKMWTDDGSTQMFADIALQIAMVTVRTLESLGFKVFLSGVGSTWTSGKNLVETDVALDIDGLGEAYQLFLAQEDSQGNPIGIQPNMLLTGSPNFVQARKLYRDTSVELTGSTDLKLTSNNEWRGMFTPEHSPYLNNGAVTNANGTNWWLIHRSGITAPMAVVFLNGRRTPRVRRHTNIPGKLAMQWDADLSFGFAEHDDVASVYSPGA